RDRQPPLGRRRGLRLQPGRLVPPLAADDLAPSEDPARGWPGRVGAARNVGVLPARARGARRVARHPGRVKRALFVCIGDAGRSQMAQAFYERLGGEARSAGSRPETELHESVVEAMQDVGVDISARRPKGFTDEDVRWADVVVTMGCGDVCPFFPGKE